MTDVSDPLVAIKGDSRLIVEPIWENPIDEIEGPLYLDYIAANPGYNQVYARKTVGKMLNDAARLLPARYTLVVRAGHRPLSVQLQLLEMVKRSYLDDNPGASDKQALSFARTYVSDPAVKLPPHCCGAAVDVDMLDNETGLLVDFGCPMNTDSEIAFLHSDKITHTHKQNRYMLLEVMNSVGFAPFEHEWWHFSYGDQTWADMLNKSGPIYGLIEV